jgi:hypothetical protein
VSVADVLRLRDESMVDGYGWLADIADIIVAERALADDLAAVLAKIYFPGIYWQDEQEAVLARYREARQ